MTQISEINGPVCDRVREIINEKLGPALKEIGLELEMKTMRYDSDTIRVASFEIKLANAPSKEEKALWQELKTRQKYDWMVELDGSLEATIRTRSGPAKVKLWGYNGRKKNSWLVKETDKLDEPERYEMSDAKVEQLFKK